MASSVFPLLISHRGLSGIRIDAARKITGKPHAIVLDTLMGKGVRTFEERDKNHFIRVEPDEWRLAREQLEENAQLKTKRNA